MGAPRWRRSRAAQSTRIQELLSVLAERRARGEIQFLEAHEDTQEVIVIWDKNDHKSQSFISTICRKANVSLILIPARSDLSLKGAPAAPKITNEIVSRIKTLMEAVTIDEPMLGLVVPELWAIALQAGDISPFQPAVLQVGFRTDLPQENQEWLACELATALQHPLGLLFKGRLIEVKARPRSR